MIDCCERLYEEERLQGLKNDGKNHQKVVLTELSETGTENPIHHRSVHRQVKVEELRSKLSYNLILYSQCGVDHFSRQVHNH